MTFWGITLLGLLSISIPLSNALLDFAYTIHDADVKSYLKDAATAQENYCAPNLGTERGTRLVASSNRLMLGCEPWI